jgi:hypothetical protein
MKLDKVRVYEEGGFIVFAENDGTVITAEPKGSVRSVPFGASGFSFERLVTGDGICYVDSYDDVLDSTGVAWGGSFAATLAALGLFFLKDSGGIDAQYYTGNFHTFLTAVASATSYNNAIGPNLLLGFPIYVGADCTFEQLKVKVTGGAVGNSVWGLYECEDGLPTDLIFQTTPVNNNVAAVSIYTIPTPIQIKKGFYYVGYSSSSQPSLSCAPATVVPAAIGGDISDVPSPLIGRAFVYTGTLPATWGTPTSFYTANSVQFVPLVQFKISI